MNELTRNKIQANIQQMLDDPSTRPPHRVLQSKEFQEGMKAWGIKLDRGTPDVSPIIEAAMRSKPSRAFVLRVAPSGEDRVEEAVKNDFITIGWSDASNILHQENWWAFREEVKRLFYPDDDNYRRAGRTGGQLWQFLREMQIGDWVVVPHWNGFYVCEIVGEATHNPDLIEDDTAFRRSVRWLNEKAPIERWHASAALQSRMKIQGTCAYAQDLVDDIDSVLQGYGTAKLLPKESVFAQQLHTKLVETTLATIRSGKIDSFGFERLLQTLFTSEGGNAEIVARQLDKGADLKVTFRFASVAQAVVGVQAKHYQPEPPVGAHVADELLTGLEDVDADFGMIVTSGTVSAELEARVQEIYANQGVRIQLVDGEQLATWIVERGLKLLS